MFVYDDLGNVLSIRSDWQVGFDAGDEIRGIVVLDRETEFIFDDVMIFRIDGKCVILCSEIA